MANPAIKNGYVPIANELAEYLASISIPSDQMRIIWVIWRKTWGWADGERRKDWDWISLTQFEKMTGMNRRNVSRSLKTLVANKLLLRKENLYKFNQNYNEWIVAKRLRGVARMVIGGSLNGKKGVANKLHTKEILQKKLTKETLQPTADETKNIVNIINSFKGINPTINFGNRTTRRACLDLIKQFGLEETLKLVDYAISIQGQPYSPVITNPYQLKEKVAQLKIFYDKSNKSKTISV